MWRTAVILFNGLLLCLVGSLSVVRREPSTATWIVFEGDNHLYRMNVHGGAMRRITDRRVREFAVAPDGDSIVYFHKEDDSALLTLRQIRGSADQILLKETNPQSLTWAQDGRSVAYLAFEEGSLRLISLAMDSLQRQRVLDEPVSIIQPAWGGHRLAAYKNGDAGTELFVVDTLTGELRLASLMGANPMMPPAFSPGGEWVAFAAVLAYQPNDMSVSLTSSRNNLYIVHHDGRALRLIIVSIDILKRIIWADDWIVFSAIDASVSQAETMVYKVRPDGSQLTPLTDANLNASAIDVSFDGKWILASAQPLSRLSKISLLRINIDGATVEEIPTPFNRVQNAQWSAPVNLRWNPTLLLVAGILTGGVHVAYRRFVV